MERHVWKIIHESAGILIIASVLSSLGGIGLQALTNKLALFIPLLILLPSLNDMIGDFGSIIASRFSMMLFKKEIKGNQWWRCHELLHLFFVVMGIAVLAAVYSAVLAYGLSIVKGFMFDRVIAMKVLFIAMITTIVLVSLLCIVSVAGGLYVYKKKHNPDNYLIPLTTAIGDLGSMLVLSALMWWFL